MRNALQALIELQKIDCQLQKLEQSKGDLPQKIKDDEAELQRLSEGMKARQEECEQQKSRKIAADAESVVLREKLKKYRAQLYQVKNNKEYDAITVEIENTEQALERSEYESLEIEETFKTTDVEIAEMSQKIEAQRSSLAESQKLLAELLDKTRDEEELLMQKRSQLTPKLSRPMLNTYERIRGGRSGLALAMLKDSACSECSSRIPPQRGLEIRMMDKLYLCETCGRIMVWLPDNEQICSEDTATVDKESVS